MMVEVSLTPHDTPWRMPLTLLRFPLEFDRPWPAEERLAHNMVTTLRGALDREILGEYCTRPDCEPHRRCPLPDCVAGILTKPSTDYGKRRDHPPSFSLEIEGEGLKRSASLTLWGRRSSALATDVEMALRRVARGQARVHGHAFPFLVGEGERLHASLGDWVWLAPVPKGPVFTRHRVVLPRATGPENLAYLAANVAHDLVQWDLADSGLAAASKPREVDDIGDRARAAATLAFQGLRWRVLRLSRLHDEKLSQRNGKTRSVDAAELDMELSGEIEPAWPWLRAMSLRGPGSRLSLGISYLSIFVARS